MTLPKAAEVKTLNADIVIIGGGGAGLSAAVAAAEKGIKNIIVLEKRGTGGNSAMAFGIFAAESPVQKRANINITGDECFKVAMNWSKWRTNPRILRAFINKSGDTVKWLEGKGLRFECGPFYPNQLPTFHIPEGRGSALMKVLKRKCEEYGVKIMIHTPAKQILCDKKGRVTGVRAESSKSKLNIRSRNIVIATGGFGGNIKLLKQLCSDYHDNMERVGLPHTGDGLLMAKEIGAATEKTGALLLGGPSSLHPPDLLIKGDKTPDIFRIGLMPIAWEARTLWLNSSGRRFTDESVDSGTVPSINTVVCQKDNICHTIFDTNILEVLIDKGPVMSMGIPQNKKGKKLPTLAKDLLAMKEKGLVRIFKTLADMADWMGIDRRALTASVKEYNADCDRGHDSLFAKDKKYLIPLRKPPYYVIRWSTAFTNTIGGIVVNENMEVLDKDENPIPGLFAAGVDTGGWESETYCMRLPGHALGYALNTGRIAGENAAKLVSGK